MRVAYVTLLAKGGPPRGSDISGWANECMLSADLLEQRTLTYDRGLYDLVGAAEAMARQLLAEHGA